MSKKEISWLHSLALSRARTLSFLSFLSFLLSPLSSLLSLSSLSSLFLLSPLFPLSPLSLLSPSSLSVLSPPPPLFPSAAPPGACAAPSRAPRPTWMSLFSQERPLEPLPFLLPSLLLFFSLFLLSSFLLFPSPSSGKF